MIELNDVTKHYGSSGLAVDQLSFTVREGETFGLIGTSGCGKTTTLKMINRLVEPTSGSLSVAGENVLSQNPEQLRRNIGYVIQNVGLFPHYTVHENIAIVPKLLKWDKQRIEGRARKLLELVGLDPEKFSQRKPASLSGGQQQRVGLARALAADPPVILMDEPFGALDPITKRQIRQEVSQLFKEIKKTLVLVTHDVFEAIEMCDRLCLLDQGKVQQVGTSKELLFQPANQFVESFFASNRFQLELLSITIGDIIETDDETELYWSPPLPSAGDDKRSDKTEVHTHWPLYDVLEKMEKTVGENTVIIKRKNGQVEASLGFTNLLNRFQQFKKDVKAGGSDG